MDRDEHQAERAGRHEERFGIQQLASWTRSLPKQLSMGGQDKHPIKQIKNNNRNYRPQRNWRLSVEENN